MKTKIIILTAFIVGIFLVGTVSAGIFDWLIHPKTRTIYKQHFIFQMILKIGRAHV